MEEISDRCGTLEAQKDPSGEISSIVAANLPSAGEWGLHNGAYARNRGGAVGYIQHHFPKLRHR